MKISQIDETRLSRVMCIPSWLTCNGSYELLSVKKLAHEVLTHEVVYANNKNESLLAETAHLTLNINSWSN